MDNDKINNNYKRKNHFTEIIKAPIISKKIFSQEFPATFVNQSGSNFFDNLSKEIERIKKRNFKNESNNIISKKNNIVFA